MKNTYIDFLFEDEDSGEQFFVEIKLEANGSYKEARKKAIEIANENFDNAKIQPGWLPALRLKCGVLTHIKKIG